MRQQEGRPAGVANRAFESRSPVRQVWLVPGQGLKPGPLGVPALPDCLPVTLRGASETRHDNDSYVFRWTSCPRGSTHSYQFPEIGTIQQALMG